MGAPAGRIIALLATVAISAPCSAAQPRAARPADLVLLGGRIFTADPTRPWVDAVAIRGERVIAVGTTTAMRALAGPLTRRIELGGRTVVPGFNDAHVHLAPPLPGIAFRTCDEPVPDPPLVQVLDSLAALVRRTPTGTWLRTSIDAAMLDDARARRGALDSVAPDHPVWLAANTGHGVIVNSAALRELGIPEDAVDPAGGFYEREGAPYPGRGRGRLSGLLHEYAGWNAARTLRARQPDSILVAAFRRSGQRALRAGITSVQDMANALDPATTLRVLRLAHLPIRVRTIPMPATDATRRLVHEWPVAMRDPAWRTATRVLPVTGGAVGATKWILDGTGIERLSLLRTPYADRPAWFGTLNFPTDTLHAILRGSLAAGEQPILHVIGDSALVLVLSAMETLAPDSVWRRLRPRLEHAEWLTADLRPRARRLGVVVVENPIHFTDGPERMAARFGAARAAHYQPFRSLVEAGIPLAIGSDGPMDPFLNLLLATTHPDTPGEALTREAAVVAYTRGSAYAEHAERRKGTLAPGMLADIAVLSQDIFTVPAEALPATVSVLTLVGGRIAFDAGVLTVGRPGGTTTTGGAHRP
jgi:predicted amidohydrolase YtcJ